MMLRVRGRVHWATAARTESGLVGAWSPKGAPLDPVELSGSILARLGLARPEAFEPGDVLALGPGVGARTVRDAAALAVALRRPGGVLAEALARVFHESLLCAGVPVLQHPGLAGSLREGDDVIVDFTTGTIENLRSHHVEVALPMTAAQRRWVQERPARSLYRLSEPARDPDVFEGWGPTSRVGALPARGAGNKS